MFPVRRLRVAGFGRLSTHIYFPTYSNSLKDIGHYLGCTWTTTGATAVQSVVWRKRWEATHDSALKTALIQYNRDDCLALKTVTECTYAIASGKTPDSHGHLQCTVAAADDVQNASDYRQWGKQTFAMDALHLRTFAGSRSGGLQRARRAVQRAARMSTPRLFPKRRM